MFLRQAHMANRGTIIVDKEGRVSWIQVVSLDDSRKPDDVVAALRRIKG